MKYLIVHTEANPAITDRERFDAVNEYHRGLFGFRSALGYWCGYHYFIEKSGKVIQARLDTEDGAHTKGWNDNIGICLAGNQDLEMPTEAQINSLRELLQEKMRQHGVLRENIVPHRQFNRGKTCFGRKLADSWARDLVTPIIYTAPDPRLTWIQEQINRIRQIIEELQRSRGLIGGKHETH